MTDREIHPSHRITTARTLEHTNDKTGFVEGEIELCTRCGCSRFTSKPGCEPGRFRVNPQLFEPCVPPARKDHDVD